MLRTYDGDWQIQALLVRPAELAAQKSAEWQVRCEIEVSEINRQSWRGFILYYYPDFFELWDVAEDDHDHIACHAMRWITHYLNGNSHRLDYSIADNVVFADIRF